MFGFVGLESFDEVLETIKNTNTRISAIALPFLPIPAAVEEILQPWITIIRPLHTLKATNLVLRIKFVRGNRNRESLVIVGVFV